MNDAVIKQADEGGVAVRVKGKGKEKAVSKMEMKQSPKSPLSGFVNYLAPEFDEAFEENVPPVRHPTHKDNADPIVQPRLVANRPGPMRTQGEIILHTRAAHRLFYGRRQDEKQGIKAIIGLVRFSTNVNAIVGCAANNDPWADAVLLKIEERFSAVNALVKGNIEALDQLLDGMEGLSICFNESVKPVKMPVEFKSVYGFMGARLLGQYDKLVRLGLVARHVGLLFEDDWGRLIGKPGSSVREVFWLSATYRFTGATRDDVAANNEAARRAVAKYGTLPQDVLEGTRRARHAPVIRVSSALSGSSTPASE